jgi:flagellar M-ring protein FliF
MPFRQIASRLSPKGWMMAGGALAITIVFFMLLTSLAGKPSYSTLLTGLDPAQTGKITSALDTKGIGYEIQNNGTALAVQSSQTGQARIALATAGLLGASSQPGMELLNNQPLGQSNFQQQITYQRALEGQLAQTIEQIQGVSSAQVQLVLPNPQDQLFSDTTQPATAAVLLSGSSSLDPNSVKGIAQLVSSSVPGLKAEKVTITDGSGSLLWPTADTTGSGGGSLLAKQTAQERYDGTMAAQVNAMLAQTLGPNKAEVQINADLNTNQTTSDAITYAKKGTPIQQQTSNETLTGTGSTGTGAASTAGNIPGFAQTTGGGKSNYKNTSSTTTYGVNKVVTHSTVSPGAINRQTISVLVDKSVPASALPALKSAVASAVGLNAKRGDQISVAQMAFAKVPAAGAPAAAGPASMMKYAKYGIVGLGAIIFLFFITRMLRRREREPFASEPTWLRELATPRPLPQIETIPPPDEPTQIMALRTPVNVAKKQVEDLVQRDADRVAQHVRAWMSED